jgi:hypothetical protein
MKRFQLGLVLLLTLTSCTRFNRYNAGTAELWIGGQVNVEQECRRRGAAALVMNSRILGCTDFLDAVIISIADPKIIAHEYCHWSRKTASHEICPEP